MPIHRSVVYLKVPGVYYGAQWSFDGDAHRIGYAVTDTEPANFKVSTELVSLVGFDWFGYGSARSSPLLKLHRDEAMS